MEVRSYGLSSSHWKWALAFFLLNIADAAITVQAVSNGFEMNPIMRLLLGQPIWIFWLTKIALGGGISFLLLNFTDKHPAPVRRILQGLVIAMAGICLWNLLSL